MNILNIKIQRGVSSGEIELCDEYNIEQAIVPRDEKKTKLLFHMSAILISLRPFVKCLNILVIRMELYRTSLYQQL